MITIIVNFVAVIIRIINQHISIKNILF